MWFRYERNNGRWCPVVYHSEEPKVPKGEESAITKSIRVPLNCIDAGEPMFGRLVTLIPPPLETME